MSDEAEARLGTRLGNYALHEIIGRGGMGVVYRAEHVYIHKPAAVKVLHRRYFDLPDAKARFLREAQTAAVIEHPNIVGVTDFGEAPDGTVFLVMAHVEGTGLDRLLRAEKTIPLFRSISILSQVARALAAAHDKGVVHRDLKPENIMLARRAGRREIVRQVTDERGTLEMVTMEEPFDFVTVLDFGAAKFWQQSVRPAGENTTVIGTPAYMAPETARTGVADARSDIYALGTIFYEMLTGSVPFDGDNAVDIMMKQVHEAPTPLRQRNPHVEITAEAERVIMKTLSKHPDQRHASMGDLAADLQRCYGAVRYRRGGEDSLEAAIEPEALRRPIPLVRRRTPSGTSVVDASSSGPTPVVPLSSTGSAPESRPILLVNRKVGSAPHPTPTPKLPKHKTLPFGSPLPNPNHGPETT